MKTRIKQTKQLLWAIAACVLFSFPSCQKDEELVPSVIQFKVSLQNIPEGNEAIIELELDRPAPKNVFVDIKIETNAVYSEHFTTNPPLENGSIPIGIAKGSSKKAFTIHTVDNDIFDQGKYLILTLHSPGDGLRLGSGSIIVLTIDDDEGPSKANFAVSAGTIEEISNEGITVNIPLSSPAKGPGGISVLVTSSPQAENLFTISDKVLANNAFTLHVEENQSLVSFTVKPKNNEVYTGNQTIVFSIGSVSGVVEKGNNLSFSLTIEDDELPSIANFALNGGIINEDEAAGMKIDIPFSGPAKGSGKVVVTFASSAAKYGAHFTTSKVKDEGSNSITFNVAPGETGVDFTVLPMKDFTVTGNMEINFTIASVEGVVLKGTKLSYSLTIINVDLAAKISFAEASGEVAENANEIVITLPFSGPAPGGGTIKLTYSSNLVYGADFTTDPPVLGNSITFDYNKNETSKSFKVKPVNNSHCWNVNQSNLITWKIDVITGGALEKGDFAEYNLAVKDDEEANLFSLEMDSGTINENDGAGVEVKINFSRPTETSGTIYFTTDWWGHQSRLTTNPPYDYDCYWYCYDPAMPIAQGATGRSFKIFPLNNTTQGADYMAKFTVYSSSANGCLQPAGEVAYMLTIADDD